MTSVLPSPDEYADLAPSPGSTVGMLPENLRQRLGLPFSRRDQSVFGALASASRASGPLVRGPLREFGLSYVGWRRKALARGDVAGAGSEPSQREAVAL